MCTTSPSAMPPRRAAAASSARRRCDSAAKPRRTSACARTISPVASTPSSVRSSTPRCQAVPRRTMRGRARRCRAPAAARSARRRASRGASASRARARVERSRGRSRHGRPRAAPSSRTSALAAQRHRDEREQRAPRACPAPTSTDACADVRMSSSTPIAVTATMIGSPVAPRNATESAVAAGSTRAARRACEGSPRTTNRSTSTTGSASEQDRIGQERLEVERDAGVDEEDRHEEAERDGLDLALDRLAVGLVGVAHEEPPHDAGGERAEQHVEVEHDAERDEGRRGSGRRRGSRTGPTCAASR